MCIYTYVCMYVRTYVRMYVYVVRMWEKCIPLVVWSCKNTPIPAFQATGVAWQFFCLSILEKRIGYASIFCTREQHAKMFNQTWAFQITNPICLFA